MNRKYGIVLLFLIILIVLAISVLGFIPFGSRSEGNGSVAIPATPLIEAPSDAAPGPTLSPSEFGDIPHHASQSLSDVLFPIRDFLFQDNNDLLISPDNLGVQKAVNWLVEWSQFCPITQLSIQSKVLAAIWYPPTLLLHLPRCECRFGRGYSSRWGSTKPKTSAFGEASHAMKMACWPNKIVQATVERNLAFGMETFPKPQVYRLFKQQLVGVFPGNDQALHRICKWSKQMKTIFWLIQ